MTDDGYARLLERQRLAFEAQFGSLESMGFEDKTKKHSTVQSDNDDNGGGQDNENEESEDSVSFKGFSDQSVDEDSSEDVSGQEILTSSRRLPKIIKFQDPSGIYQPPSKKQQKEIRSGKPLGNLPQETEEQHSDPESDSEQQNLRNDIELQQFLQESHLLSALDSSNNLHGKARGRALEMHLTDLSSASGGPQKLEKVPMQVRKGMVARHLQRIHKHEQEAAEAGIILAKTKKGQFRRLERTYKNDMERRIGSSIKSKDRKRKSHRQRGLKVQTVGRSTRNGLVLSKEDIDRIRNR
ncbi:FAF1 (YIL019W) [Zygosaccharomyces parabailii]|uniref:BN860_02476g1_1 n=1 Tax=Zygosaccharomyces bailii (strain CLIB 213 / ATCC 58445 / CBS 680 / BCRC 21525 / NBRC 1098 / NCYC 1416 / NRRL Y-2227) TaxID=1333698 RepID=A0A8J2T4V5_ZYGB2|nr:FAF1 (YIL019W) [Zygosaccharomyces parabailii]CDF88106.1 BN860_02476g1_1 [Zygosaccharomyces bailii CLIB 213]